MIMYQRVDSNGCGYEIQDSKLGSILLHSEKGR